MREIVEAFEELRRYLYPTKRELLTWEFAERGLALPPPSILEDMLQIDYPDWDKMARVLAILWTPVPPRRGRLDVSIHHLIPLKKVLSDMLRELADDPIFEE